MLDKMDKKVSYATFQSDTIRHDLMLLHCLNRDSTEMLSVSDISLFLNKD